VHELSIATQLYQRCDELRGGREELRIEEARIAVGELSSVDPDLLSLAWEALVTGGSDEGASLRVEWRPARQCCPLCGEVAERQPGSWLRLCPTCGTPLRVEGGDELDLLRVVFEEPARTGGPERC